MVAVDTNLIVRIVTNDDPKQASRAAALFTRDRVFIPKTVLLEAEWVLRYSYELSRSAVAHAFRLVIGLPNVTVEAPAQVADAIEWFERGLDFADALHLASGRPAGRFATLDARMARKAKTLTDIEFVSV